MYRVIVASESADQEVLSFPPELKVSVKSGYKNLTYYYTVKDIDDTYEALKSDGWRYVQTQRSSGTGSMFVERDGVYLKLCIRLVGSGYRGTNMFPEHFFDKRDYARLRGDRD